MELSELLEELRKVEKKLDLKFSLANSYFHFSKLTLDNCKYYITKQKRRNTLQLVFGVFLTLVKVLLNIFISFSFRLISSKSGVSRLASTESMHGGYLFISHHNRVHTNDNNSDQFFGNIPSELTEQNKIVNIYLLNHTKKSSQKILEQYPSNTINLIRHVNPRGVSLRNNVYVHRIVLNDCIKLLFQIFSSKEDDYRQKLLKVQAISKHAHRSTLSTIFLGFSISKLANQIKPKRVVMTLEGHAHELFLKTELGRNFPNLEFYFYQHAPVVPDQHGLWQTIQKLSQKDHILTSGEFVMSYLKLKVPELQASIAVLGSSRSHSPYLYKARLEPDSHFTILIAPEAFASQVNHFISIAIFLSKQFPDCTVRFRLHPATGNLAKFQRKITALKVDNIICSFAPLREDLLQANVCIYQSSSVALEGLFYGVLPVHYSFLAGINLDPLSPMLDDHFHCDSELQLSKVLGQVIKSERDKSGSVQVNFASHAEMYFSPLTLNAIQD